MEAGDVIQIKSVAITPNIGDEMINIYFYRLDSGTPLMDDIIGAFILKPLLAIRGMQTDGVQYRSIEAINLFNLDEFAVRSYSGADLAGLLVEATAPPSTAVGFTLRRSSRTVRNGAKRIGGVPNANVVQGALTGTSFLAQVAAVAGDMGEPMEEGVSDAVLTPVIVKRIKTPNPDYPDDSKYPFKYLLPTEQGQTPIVPVAGVGFSSFATTQTTRKTNR